MNLYGFADGDPVNRSDPFGLCAGPLATVCARIVVFALGRVAPLVASIGAGLTGLSAGPAVVANTRAAATLGRLTATLEANIGKLDDIHLNAAAREAAGEVVARDLTGRAFDHVTEVRNAIRGVRNALSGANRLLRQGQPTPEQRQQAEMLRQRAIEALVRAQEALGPAYRNRG